MKRNPIETVLGAVVLVIAAMFMAFAYSTADTGTVTGYEITANFLKIGGLEAGSDVRISGVPVGTVTRQSLNRDTYEAEVVMSIAPDIVLPTDTEASIVSDGLLGGKYVNLSPGQSKDRIAAGGKVSKAKDYQSLEDLVGRIIFLATQEPKEGTPQ